MPGTEFNGAVDMAPQAASTYIDGKLYLIEVRIDGVPRMVRARPYYRRLLRDGRVRVFFRTSTLELVTGRVPELGKTRLRVVPA
jgi:hypothetical protein